MKDELDRLSTTTALICALAILAHERPHEPQHLAQARHLQVRWLLDVEQYRARLRRGRREPRQGKP